MLFATPMNHGILMVGFTKTNFNFWNILVMHKLYRCIIKREWVNEKVSIVDVLHLFANFTLSLYQHNFLFCDSRKRIFYNVTVVHYLMIIWMKINLVSLANFPIFPPLLDITEICTVSDAEKLFDPSKSQVNFWASLKAV